MNDNILTIDVGNTNVDIALFEKNILTKKFTTPTISPDLEDIFQKIEKIGTAICCSVVPDINENLQYIFKKRFGYTLPMMHYTMTTNVDYDRKFKDRLGQDFIANACGADILYPEYDHIIFGLGTAITISMVKSKRFSTIAITPGLRISCQSLTKGTAMIGKTIFSANKYTSLLPDSHTIDLINSGVFIGAVGLIREFRARVQSQFDLKNPLVIATGGDAQLFADTGVVDKIEPNLAHYGLLEIARLNL